MHALRDSTNNSLFSMCDFYRMCFALKPVLVKLDDGRLNVEVTNRHFLYIFNFGFGISASFRLVAEKLNEDDDSSSFCFKINNHNVNRLAKKISNL